MKTNSILLALLISFCFSCKKEMNKATSQPSDNLTNEAVRWNTNTNDSPYVDYFCRSNKGC
jgi:hypothetical protein